MHKSSTACQTENPLSFRSPSPKTPLEALDRAIEALLAGKGPHDLRVAQAFDYVLGAQAMLRGES